jgi:uncharacterized protein (TIGR02145 family)
MNQKVTFSVSWTGTPYNNHVWVWVDFCPVAGTSPGTFEKAVISAASVTSGNYTDLNGRGFFVTANGATITATLNASGKFSWCAYGSDYPPNVLANTNSSYTLAGTPPFKLIASNGATSLTVSGTTIATSALTFTPATITDTTGYPGLWCPYTGSDLYMDISHRCMERQSGAGNWEAWIKDSRDNELYRIVKMPDNKWWLAQNVKYTGTGTQPSWCTKDECGRYYTHAQARGAWGGSSGTGANIQGICPNNWVIPMQSNYEAILSSYSSIMAEQCKILTPKDSRCDKDDYYGLSSEKTICGCNGGANNGSYEMHITNDGAYLHLIINNNHGYDPFLCGHIDPYDANYSGHLRIVRCIRQL